jgi:cation diffusion facilitator family transporter
MLGKIRGLHKKQHVALLSIAAAVATLGLKFGAYFISHSIALYSDALETFVNLAAGFIAFAMVTIASKPPDEKHSYGHDKAEYFSSGVEGGLILIAAVSIVYLSIERLVSKQPLQHLLLGIGISAVASLINFGCAYYIAKVAKEHDSITLEANAKHLMTDVWTSMGVAAGLLIVYFLPPAFQLLDPVIAIGVALLILSTGLDLLKRSVDGFMDAALPEREIADIESIIRGCIQAPQQFRALRTRKAGSKRFIEFTLLLKHDMTVEKSHALCDYVEAAINQRFPTAVIHIHVEPLTPQG